MPIVSVIVTADKIPHSPLYKERVVDGQIDNPRTTMSQSNLNYLLDAIYQLACRLCVRDTRQPHTCISITTCSYDNGTSIHVIIVYTQECLYDSQNEMRFIEAIKNRMNRERATSHRSIMPPDKARC